MPRGAPIGYTIDPLTGLVVPDASDIILVTSNSVAIGPYIKANDVTFTFPHNGFWVFIFSGSCFATVVGHIEIHVCMDATSDAISGVELGATEMDISQTGLHLLLPTLYSDSFPVSDAPSTHTLGPRTAPVTASSNGGDSWSAVAIRTSGT